MDLRELLPADESSSPPVPLLWQEAVAIAQELNEVASAAGGGMPPPEDLILTPAGAMELRSAPSPGGQPAVELARMLDGLLTGANPPPELRALVSEWAAGVPREISLGEFRRRLAFFERPSRRADITAVVDRAVATRASVEREAELERLEERTRAAAARQARPAGERSARLSRLTRIVTVSAAAALAAVAIAFGVDWMVPRVPGAWSALPSVDAAGAYVTQALLGCDRYSCVAHGSAGRAGGAGGHGTGAPRGPGSRVAGG